MFLTLLRPKYWPGHVAMILSVSFAVGLGVWQFDAWQTRRADAAVDISNDEPVALDSVMTGDGAFPGKSLGRQVSFSGTWMAESTLFIADRELAGESGYWVVTPVLVQGSASAIPVIRGWSATAAATAPTGAAEVTGWLQATEGSSPLDEDPHDNILTGMRLASMVEHVDADLYSGYVVAREIAGAGGADGVALRSVSAGAVPEVSGFTALRNFLYAVEWWVFGSFALFIWVRWCKDTLELLDVGTQARRDA